MGADHALPPPPVTKSKQKKRACNGVWPQTEQPHAPSIRPPPYVIPRRSRHGTRATNAAPQTGTAYALCHRVSASPSRSDPAPNPAAARAAPRHRPSPARCLARPPNLRCILPPPLQTHVAPRRPPSLPPPLLRYRTCTPSLHPPPYGASTRPARRARPAQTPVRASPPARAP